MAKEQPFQQRVYTYKGKSDLFFHNYRKTTSICIPELNLSIETVKWLEENRNTFQRPCIWQSFLVYNIRKHKEPKKKYIQWTLSMLETPLLQRTSS